ncbi:hypothetical protein D3C80_1149030 [compost metagenome]
MTQKAVLQIAFTVEHIDDMTVIILRQRVDGEIAAQQILLKRDVRRGVACETGITQTGFAFRARQGVFFARFWVKKHGEIAAYLLIARVKHLFWCGTNHNPVFIFDRQTQQRITYRTTDQINLHASNSRIHFSQDDT